MNRLFGLITGAVASFVATYVSTTRNQIKENHPKLRAGICGPECRTEDRPDWKTLPQEDPRSPRFLSYLETIWVQELTPGEKAVWSGTNMERVLFGHTELLLDDLVARGALSAHESQHLKSYYEAMIFRTVVRH